MNNILLYGANGYTGKLILQNLASKGIKPILAGRNASEIKQLAKMFGLEHRVFSLGNEEEILKGLENIHILIHAAGPFKFTSKPMVEACLKTKTHYLDITGEIEVYERCALLDGPAKDAGIMVMPGAGFDVVPTDCLALHLKNRMPEAVSLQLAFVGLRGSLSRGTAKTVIENLGRGGAVRRNGKITFVPNAYKTMVIDFGEMKMRCATIPWGDVATAWSSTGIPNIEVFTGVNKRMLWGMKLSNFFSWLLRTSFVKNSIRKRVDGGPPGPSDEERKGAKSYLWGKVTDPSGKSCVSLLKTPEGYTLTAMTSVSCAEKILAGNFKPGYQTPATAFGADFILEMEGCERKDV